MRLSSAQIFAVDKGFHGRLMEIAKSHKCTRDFGHMMFSGPEAYEKGWIRAAFDEAGHCLGFTCVRHKVRQPETSLYFIGVDERFRRGGWGTVLLEDLKTVCPHRRIVLNCRKDNLPAIHFYHKHGFLTEGESLKGEGLKLALTW